MANAIMNFATTQQKANRAISFASACIGSVVIFGTVLRLRMEGFHPVFPLMWLGALFSISPLILINQISYPVKSFSLWLSWTLMAFGAFLMFGIGSAGVIFFLIATTFASLNFSFRQVMGLIFFKSTVLILGVWYFSLNGGLPIPPQGIEFFKQPHIWIVHIIIASIAAVVIVYVTTVWNNLTRHLLEKSEISFYQGVGLLSLAHDTETGSHLSRVSTYTRLLVDAHKPKLPGRYVGINSFDFSLASELHDIGKISIPASVLQKPGKLTSAEFDLVKSHTTIGAELIEQMIEKSDGLVISRLRLAQEIALSHHENWDGSGYPNGLALESIPFGGRVVAICDVYDALRSKRPYKSAYSHNEAVAIMDEETHKFDPEIYQTFKEIQDEFARVFDQIDDAAYE